MIADTMTTEEYKQSEKAKYVIAFDEAWKRCAPPGAPVLISEYLFAKPHRNWRADKAILDPKIIIEFDGAVWVSGRHTRGSGYIEDCYKLNYAVSLGYSVFRFTPEMLKEPEYAVQQVLAIACGSKPPLPPAPPKKPKRAKKHYKATVEIMDNKEIDVRFKKAHRDYIVAMAAKVQQLGDVLHTPINDDGFAVVVNVGVKLNKLKAAIERLVAV